MLALTEAARTQLDAYFADKDKTPIRIFVTSSCCGAKLALALDEPNEGDAVDTVDGYQFVVEKELLAQAAPLTVDLSPMGFTVASSLELGNQGGCGGGCSGGESSGGGCSGGSCSC